MAASLRSRRPWLAVLLVVVLCLVATPAEASLGDRLPEFRECVNVCERDNCNSKTNPSKIPLHRRLLLWTCPQECDYACQHIITAHRVGRNEPITQFHGKWPFNRMLGMQEPFSVLFSLGNLAAHQQGLAKIRRHVPKTYPLRPFYVLFAWFGTASWVFSAIFHTRDFVSTEQLDYFAAGASVLYGLYYALVRVARLDQSPRLLGLWTLLCAALYAAHVSYLKFWRWDYTYNMAANVAVGLVHNLLWYGFCVAKWRETHAWWSVWPGLIVSWIMLVMGLELLDFPPLAGAFDAHSLWHLGTIPPCIMWYNFMIRDTEDDIAKSKVAKPKA
ncbi:PER1 protein [Microdochium trichocladiopsis]|uniref:Post-GPI attachment to proteins factor 3 n=1 Tax=Microdochium trichocladiopsis TaxID=1682393 RepID=A0A9P8YBI0_9PEZI|nr:PER1 protein [Microdochium trichocladiopsis]KAH7035004.1 PER1 protein [Microdochium trichocladiopsis]